MCCLVGRNSSLSLFTEEFRLTWLSFLEGTLSGYAWSSSYLEYY